MRLSVQAQVFAATAVVTHWVKSAAVKLIFNTRKLQGPQFQGFAIFEMT
jgi:hypothetical protein